MGRCPLRNPPPTARVDLETVHNCRVLSVTNAAAPRGLVSLTANVSLERLLDETFFIVPTIKADRSSLAWLAREAKKVRVFLIESPRIPFAFAIHAAAFSRRAPQGRADLTARQNWSGSEARANRRSSSKVHAEV